MKLGNFGVFVAALIAACAGDVRGMDLLGEHDSVPNYFTIYTSSKNPEEKRTAALWLLKEVSVVSPEFQSELRDFLSPTLPVVQPTPSAKALYPTSDRSADTLGGGASGVVSKSGAAASLASFSDAEIKRLQDFTPPPRDETALSADRIEQLRVFLNDIPEGGLTLLDNIKMKMDNCIESKKKINDLNVKIQSLSLSTPLRRQRNAEQNSERDFLKGSLTFLSSDFSVLLERVQGSYNDSIQRTHSFIKNASAGIETLGKWDLFRRGYYAEQHWQVSQTVEALIEQFLELAELNIPTEGEHAHTLYYRGIPTIVDRESTKKFNGEFFVNEDRSYDEKFIFFRTTTGLSFLELGKSPMLTAENPLGFFGDALNRRVFNYPGRRIVDPRCGLFISHLEEQFLVSLQYGRTNDPSTTYRASVYLPFLKAMKTSLVLFLEPKIPLGGYMFFTKEDDFFKDLQVALLQDLAEKINYISAFVGLSDAAPGSEEDKKVSVANLGKFEDLRNLFRELFTDDVEEEVAEEALMSVGADGRATVTASSATKKKKKKKGKKKASGGSGGAGRGKAAVVDSDEEDGAAGGASGAAEGTGEVLDNPEFLTLDPNTELQFVVEEDAEEGAAAATVLDLGAPAVEPAPETPVVRTNLQKVRDVAESLFSVAQERKTLRARDFFQTMAKAFKLEGVDFTVSSKGSDRAIHSGSGIMKGFVPHGHDRKIRTIILKKATKRLTDSAAFVERMQAKRKEKGKE